MLFSAAPVNSTPFKQEEILLWPVARDREIVTIGGIGDADAAGLFPSEIHYAGIEHE